MRCCLRFALCAVFAVILCAPSAFAETVMAVPLAKASYRATLMLSEPGLEPRACGTAAVLGDMARLDVMFGRAGLVYGVSRPDRRTLYIVVDNMKAYAAVPLQSDTPDIRDLAYSVVDSIASPPGMTVLSLREEGRAQLGSAVLNQYRVERVKSRFVATFMGSGYAMNLLMWNFGGVFPMRIDELRSLADSEGTGNFVEMTDIVYGEPSEELFFIPEQYTKKSSVLDLLLYVIANQ